MKEIYRNSLKFIEIDPSTQPPPLSLRGGGEEVGLVSSSFYKFLSVSIVSIVSFSFYQFLLVSLVSISFPQDANAAIIGKPPTNLGLVGYWSMDEGTGAYAGDSSGNKNIGTLTNGPTWVDGKRGKALSFDGSDDTVLVNPTPVSAFPITISAWVYIKSITATSEKIVNTNDLSTTNYYCGAQLGYSSTGFNATQGDCVGVGPGDRRTIVGQTTPVTGRWYHVVGVYIGHNDMDLYVDGVKETVTSDGTGTESLFSSAPLSIARWDADLDRFSDVVIDDVRIYNRALSAAEVQYLYKSGATKFAASPTNLGLVGYWSFNEGTGTRAGDSSGNGNVGTLTNMSATTDWVDGKRGKALDFDGTNDYVNAGNDSSLNITGALTISAWVKTTTTASIAIIAGKGVDNTAANQSYILEIGNTGTEIPICKVSNGTTVNQLNGVTAINDGKWHYLVCAFVPSTSLTVYVDGRQDNTTVTSVISAIQTISTNVSIGSAISSRFLPGQIDEVRIYNRALSAAEIQTLYNSTYAKFNAPQNNQITNGLVGLWSFNGPDMSGNTALDRSGQGNNGTLTNGPARAAGKVGQALNFDGVDDYVTMGDVLTDSLTTMSACAWVFHDTIDTDDAILAKRDSSGAAGILFWRDDVSSGGNDRYVFYIQETVAAGGSNTRIEGALNSTPLETWTHVCATLTLNSSKGLNLYVNGSAASSSISTVGIGNIDGGTQSLTFGEDLQINGREYNGLIDEVRIYNRVLTPAEIKRLYNMGR